MPPSGHLGKGAFRPRCIPRPGASPRGPTGAISSPGPTTRGAFVPALDPQTEGDFRSPSGHPSTRLFAAMDRAKGASPLDPPARPRSACRRVNPALTQPEVLWESRQGVILMARRSGSENRKRTVLLTARFDKQEAASIRRIADRSGLSVGALVRRALLDTPRPEQPAVPPPMCRPSPAFSGSSARSAPTSTRSPTTSTPADPATGWRAPSRKPCGICRSCALSACRPSARNPTGAPLKRIDRPAVFLYCPRCRQRVNQPSRQFTKARCRNVSIARTSQFANPRCLEP